MQSERQDVGVTAEESAVLESVLDPAYPEMLREVAHHLYATLVRTDPLRTVLGLPALAEIAFGQTERLSFEMGGGNFYMHKGTAFRLSSRDREMCRKFTGRNYHKLAREYNLSEMRVRQIIDAWQKEEFAKRQAGLFGGDESLSKKLA